MKMKSFLALAAIVALAGPLLAQGPTLMLTVKKKENTQTTSRSTSTDYYYGTYSSRSGVETLCYSVDVINAGADVPAVKVSWVLVLREAGSGTLRLVEGVRTTDLKRGQKYSFDTDVVELGSFSHSTYGNSRSTSAEPVGYLVEVIVDGKAVASATKPMDIRGKIQEARNAPKRHKF